MQIFSKSKKAQFMESVIVASGIILLITVLATVLVVKLDLPRSEPNYAAKQILEAKSTFDISQFFMQTTLDRATKSVILRNLLSKSNCVDSNLVEQFTNYVIIKPNCWNAYLVQDYSNEIKKEISNTFSENSKFLADLQKNQLANEVSVQVSELGTTYTVNDAKNYVTKSLLSQKFDADDFDVGVRQDPTTLKLEVVAVSKKPLEYTFSDEGRWKLETRQNVYLKTGVPYLESGLFRTLANQVKMKDLVDPLVVTYSNRQVSERSGNETADLEKFTSLLNESIHMQFTFLSRTRIDVMYSDIVIIDSQIYLTLPNQNIAFEISKL